MTITSPQPGVFISRPPWIGSAALDAAHTPGNAGFNMNRRIDGETVAVVLASEEAFWERAYYWWDLHSANPWSPAPQNANFLRAYYFPREHATYAAYDGRAFPSTATWWVRPVIGSTPSDRAFKSRRFYRSALDWLLENFIWSAAKLAPFFWCPLRDDLLIYDSTSAEGYYVMRPIGGDTLLSSSLLGDSTPTLPAFDWTEPENVVSELASWQGGHTLDACAQDNIFRDAAPNLNAPLVNKIADALTSPLGWTSVEWNAFVAAHQVSSLPSFGSILSAAFGIQLDYSVLRSTNRRLRLARLAAYNQSAAAMDRLYKVVQNISRFNGQINKVTNISVTGTVTGSIPSSSISWTSGEPVINPDVNVSWGTATYETETTPKSPLYEDDYVAAVTNGSCEAGAAALGVPLLQIYAKSSDIGELLRFGPAIHSEGISFSISPPICSGGNAHYTITRTDETGGTVNVVEPLQFTPPSGDLDIPVFISGRATYDYRHTVQGSMPPLVFPPDGTWQAEVVREVEECAIFVQSEGTISLGSVNPWRDLTTTKVCCKRAVANSKSAHEAIFRQWTDDNIAAVAEALDDNYPFKVGVPASLQARLSQAVEEARRNLTGNSFSPQVNFSPSGTVTGYIRGGTAEAPVIDFLTPPGTGGWLGSLDLELNPSSDASRTVPDAAVVIRIVADLQRSDWNFNTLRINQ